jgi:hypothetical protein
MLQNVPTENKPIFLLRIIYTLKKLYWHTVILKSFDYHVFSFEYQGNQKTLEELRSSVEREVFDNPSGILQSKMSTLG